MSYDVKFGANMNKMPYSRTFQIFICWFLFSAAAPYLDASTAQPPKKMSSQQSSANSENKNHLGSEKSPYLLQHKNNPIWWYSWSKKAFEKAKKENKPIFLSIGYATCHWCHVMEGDSFEKEEVAKILNEHFISIKVDREERPDVDSIYMTAVQAMTGRGGWPMSIIMTPDLKPFFGGTFIAKDRFITLLNKVAAMWKSSEKAKLLASSEDLLAHLVKISSPQNSGSKKTEALSHKIHQNFYEQMNESFDKKYGGFGKAPKFPSAMSLMVLARIQKRTGSQNALKFLTESLDKMARGGIYDQIGGGFHRYATDAKWLVPHFEKMLYTNALLISVYLEAFQLTKNPEYRQIVEETMTYVLRDLQNKDGGFFTAEDADSEKAEGKFYVWKYKELEKIVDKSELKILTEVFGVTKKGNFDTGEFSKIEMDAGLKGIHEANILNLEFDKKRPDYSKKSLKDLKEKLLKIRAKRNRPLLDTKILTSWNGLMIYSVAKAARVFENKTYLSAAINSANFILKNLYSNGRLQRRYAGGESGKAANLEDYSFLIYGLIELYQASFDSQWLKTAITLQIKQNELFWDEKTGNYFDTDGKDKTLLIRTKEIYDNAIPSGNSIAAINLLKLADLTYDDSYRKRGVKILKSVSERLLKYPSSLSMMLVALDYSLDDSKEIAVIDPNRVDFDSKILRLLNSSFIPNSVVAADEKSAVFQVPLLQFKKMRKNKPTAYVCENKICKLPTTDAVAAGELASKVKKFVLKE